MKKHEEGIDEKRVCYVCSACGLRATRGITEHEKTIDALAQMVVAMLPLAARVLSDEFSAYERYQLHDLVLTPDRCSHGVFELSILIGRLCSETARDPSRLERLPKYFIVGENLCPKRRTRSDRSLRDSD